MGRNLKSLRCNLDSAGAAPHPPRALPTQLLRTFKCFVRDLRLFFIAVCTPPSSCPTNPPAQCFKKLFLCKIFSLIIMAILDITFYCISAYHFSSLCAESARARLLLADGAITVHNVYFVKYIFPRNRTSSDLS